MTRPDDATYQATHQTSTGQPHSDREVPPGDTVHQTQEMHLSPPDVQQSPITQQESASAASEAARGSQAELSADQQLAELAAALDAARDAELRARAELENFRKRMRREQEEQLRFANWNLLRDLLEVLDNLTRAIQAAESPSANTASLLQGVRMVADQLQSVLAKYHCRRIAAKGEPFNPEIHSAVGQVPTTEYPPGTVVNVTREGYFLHERVLRPAEVVVTTAPASAPAETESASAAHPAEKT